MAAIICQLSLFHQHPSKNVLLSPFLSWCPSRFYRPSLKPYSLALKPSFKITSDHVSKIDPIQAIPVASEPPIKEQKKEVCLFYCPETEALAKRVAKHSHATIQLRDCKTFEREFANRSVSKAHDLQGKHVAFLASFSSSTAKDEQVPVIYDLPTLIDIASFILVLPFSPTGGDLRWTGDVNPSTLTETLSFIPNSKGGPTRFVTYDIHDPERFYVGDNILPYFESGIPLLRKRLLQLPDSSNVTIAYPDDGARKRFHEQLHDFPMIVCAKVREGDQRNVLKEGDPKGRHVVIVDDLVLSGHTLKECQKLLAGLGASKISAYVTHGIFSNRSWEHFKPDTAGRPEEGLANIWITDSWPLTAKEVENRPPFKVISLAESIADALQKIVLI